MSDTAPEGIDIYQQNTGFPSFEDIVAGGFVFIFHKASQFAADTAFPTRWPQIAAAGGIRGAYHFIHHNAGTIAQQVDLFARTVKRLVPGDLGPSMDVEDRTGDTLHGAYWRPRLHEFADAIEARLGRQPIIYTSRSYWQEFLEDDRTFGDYPLWVVWVNPGAPALPASWNRWTFWQWHWEQSTSPMPAPFAASDRGVDLNRFNGTLHQLRGLADLGRPSPYLSGGRLFAAFSEPDGTVHQLSRNNADIFIDNDLTFSASAPLAAGDPAALGVGTLQCIYYRGRDDNHLYELSRDSADPNPRWEFADLTAAAGGSAAIAGPHALAAGNVRRVVYWGDDNHTWCLTCENGAWRAEDLGAAAALATAGTPVLVAADNTPHVIGRTGTSGDLTDFRRQGNQWTATNLLAAVRDAANAPVHATYRPAAYRQPDGPTFVVFRAVRGAIWQLNLQTAAATNLSAVAGGAPAAAGAPDAFWVNHQPHIVYRTGDGQVVDLFFDTAWHFRTIPFDTPVAADPAGLSTAAAAACVVIRDADDTIQVARYDGATWSTE